MAVWVGCDKGEGYSEADFKQLISNAYIWYNGELHKGNISSCWSTSENKYVFECGRRFSSNGLFESGEHESDITHEYTKCEKCFGE